MREPAVVATDGWAAVSGGVHSPFGLKDATLTQSLQAALTAAHGYLCVKRYHPL